VIVLLDIDGVLLGTDPTRPSRLALAPHAAAFLTFAVRHFEVRWLAPQGNGDAAAALQHLVRHTKMSEREAVLAAAAKVRPSRFAALRTEALPADGRFAWFDDGPSPDELAALRQRGWLDRWQWVDTREEPEDLLRAQKWLAARVGVAEN
jgi:hypothetical protein